MHIPMCSTSTAISGKCRFGPSSVVCLFHFRFVSPLSATFLHLWPPYFFHFYLQFLANNWLRLGCTGCLAFDQVISDPPPAQFTPNPAGKYFSFFFFKSKQTPNAHANVLRIGVWIREMDCGPLFYGLRIKFCNTQQRGEESTGIHGSGRTPPRQMGTIPTMTKVALSTTRPLPRLLKACSAREPFRKNQTHWLRERCGVVWCGVDSRRARETPLFRWVGRLTFDKEHPVRFEVVRGSQTLTHPDKKMQFGNILVKHSNSTIIFIVIFDQCCFLSFDQCRSQPILQFFTSISAAAIRVPFIIGVREMIKRANKQYISWML